MHTFFLRYTRRIIFKTDAYEGTLYKRSPYFVGTKPWDALPIDVTDIPDVLTFKVRLRWFGANPVKLEYLCL